MLISSPRRLRQGGTIAALAASLMLGACGQTLKTSTGLFSVANSDQTAALPQKSPAPAPQAQDPAASGGVSTELLKATDYWGQIYAKNPRDLQPALSYARNLKAMGEKRRALVVLQQASIYHGQDRELASEYGRLALDLGQVSVAKQLLAVADDPARPDWRVISARGAALAKEGKYDDAIPYFERARVLSQDQPSVMSNLALAYAMNGDAGKAETMLRQAAASDDTSPRIRQNLALVLGLRGKYDEAKLVAARDMPMNNATENADYLRQVVQLDPKSVPDSEPAQWNTESKMIAQLPTVDAVPVENVARLSSTPVSDPAAANDHGWVVSEPVAPAAVAAAPSSAHPKILSVSEMAAQFAVADDATAETPAKEPEHKNSVVAQIKR
ncbi:tetratricopeptide repeat protein [Hyphomicrobium sp. NDB2Meth4]|uniref:tetratricopeptide repeat protein n=1 Tax=Hyphomicrobium sp. NDB2Meth4 TaxID=1892846 RepID=UPI00092FEF57|nr:tetratricopeptide repeat protein [Hyphomicrobium sp. NDB2Meth4]